MKASDIKVIIRTPITKEEAKIMIEYLSKTLKLKKN